MTPSRFVLQSLRHYWKGHLGLAFGAFLAAAVLSGSLLVGDSVRASLRRVAEARLAGVGAGLIGGDRWFRAALAEAGDEAPVILADGAASSTSGGVRVNAIQIVGADSRFWSLSPSGEALDLGAGEVAVNASLARKLGAATGDTILVRMEQPSAISRDAPLSGSTNEEVTLRRTIARILGPEQFGAFQLAASQTSPDTVFFAIQDLQLQLDMEGLANVLLTSREDAAAWQAGLESRRGLEDLGLNLTAVEGSTESQAGTRRVFLDTVLGGGLLSQPGAYGVLTYLVNGITSEGGGTPYSMVTALDEAGLARIQSGPLADGEILVTAWLAEDQKLKAGDTLTLRYFVAGAGRQLKEESASFKVAGVLPMDTPGLDRSWTPRFPGVSDVENCRDWDPGIPMDTQAIRDVDEKYWDDYGETPKAFINLEAGRALWENRFGNLTSVRFPQAVNEAALLERLPLASLGLTARDLKSGAAAAARGSVDFGGLFTGLSFFLIAAAMIFAALLFVFTLERRASQTGLLMALGWSRAKVRSALLWEAGWTAVAGVAAGVAAGGLYTKLALAGLSGVWSGAAPGLEMVYAPQPATMAVSAAGTLLLLVGVLWWSSRRIFATTPRQLLTGQTSSATGGPSIANGGRSWLKPLTVLGLAAALLVAGAFATSAEAVAGLFFGAGALLLASGLMILGRLMKGGALWHGPAGVASLWRLGLSAVTRRPSRSLAVAGMMAAGIFLVTAVNAFRMGVDDAPGRRDTGTGGFQLAGESSLPVYESLTSQAGMEAFGMDEELLQGVEISAFRVLDGDDASCLNLNRAQRPVLCGADAAVLARRGSFVFASGTGWNALESRAGAGAPVPAVIDQATAMWGLGKGMGDLLTYQDGQGRDFEVVIAGLLAGSVLQGKIIIAEQEFLDRFPNTPGYRFFLIDTGDGDPAEIADHLTRQLEKRGMALESAADRLAAFLAVQNTYIGIFTVLGGLGVLLGTAGLGVLVARHVLERRGELGLMIALGFRGGALRRMILGEHAALLAAGLVLGVVSALVAVAPGLQRGGQAPPWALLTGLWAAVLVCGVAVCQAAATMAVRGRLLDAIRRE